MHETWCSTFIPLFNHFNNNYVGSAGIYFVILISYLFIYFGRFYFLFFMSFSPSFSLVLWFPSRPRRSLWVPFLLVCNFFVGSTSHFEWGKRIHRNARAVTEKIVNKIECIIQASHGGVKRSDNGISRSSLVTLILTGCYIHVVVC